MIDRATPADAQALEDFLRPFAETSMFLRGNLAAHGTQERDHPHGTAFYLRRENGQITGVAGCTNGGYLMVQTPDCDAAFLGAFAAALNGRNICGMTGVPEQIEALVQALHLDPQDFALRRIEPLYSRALKDIATTADGARLRQPAPEDAAMLAPWFEGYHRDTGMGAPVDARTAAQVFIAKPDARLLMADGHCVAMTALNARVRESVQVGGVYVPPAFRGRGFGGKVVALHLQELAGEGITQAILFAASPFAARAYERIGFMRVGRYEVAMLKTPMVIGAEGQKETRGMST